MNTNGLLSFGAPYEKLLDSYPPGVTADVPTIAPFYANVDTSFQGNISVMEVHVNDSELVGTVLSLIAMSFEQTTEFTPSVIYNVSWERVGRFSSEELDTVSPNYNSVKVKGF